MVRHDVCILTCLSTHVHPAGRYHSRICSGQYWTTRRRRPRCQVLPDLTFSKLCCILPKETRPRHGGQPSTEPGRSCESQCRTISRRLSCSSRASSIASTGTTSNRRDKYATSCGEARAPSPAATMRSKGASTFPRSRTRSSATTMTCRRSSTSGQPSYRCPALTSRSRFGCRAQRPGSSSPLATLPQPGRPWSSS